MVQSGSGTCSSPPLGAASLLTGEMLLDGLGADLFISFIGISEQNCRNLWWFQASTFGAGAGGGPWWREAHENPWQSTGKGQSFSRTLRRCLGVQDFHARGSGKLNAKSWDSIPHWAGGGAQKGSNGLKDIKSSWSRGLIRAG